ncbi:MAG: hypothetical protein Q9195_005474 [Heterodermia aff. obscurata]
MGNQNQENELDIKTPQKAVNGIIEGDQSRPWWDASSNGKNVENTARIKVWSVSETISTTEAHISLADLQLLTYFRLLIDIHVYLGERMRARWHSQRRLQRWRPFCQSLVRSITGRMRSLQRVQSVSLLGSKVTLLLPLIIA